MPVEGHEIELVRFKRSPMPYDILCWTRGLVSSWRLERLLQDRDCLSSRPKVEPPRRYGPKYHLKKEEHAALEQKGLQPEFKL